MVTGLKDLGSTTDWPTTRPLLASRTTARTVGAISSVLVLANSITARTDPFFKSGAVWTFTTCGVEVTISVTES